MSQDLNDEKEPVMRTERLTPFPERLCVRSRQKAGRRKKRWEDEVTELTLATQWGTEAGSMDQEASEQGWR